MGPADNRTMWIALLITVLSLGEVGREPGTAGGEIRGQLSITRTLTKQRVVLPSYQVRGMVAPRHEAHEAEGAPVNEWDRVVVYLDGPGAPAAASVEAVIDQKGERFVPETLVVPVGSSVRFPNSDPIFHNVFSLSDAKEFDLGFYPAGETRTVRFDYPGVVQVYCRLHSHMNAAIVVVPNAWHTRPDDQGAFFFPDLPPGAYQIVVWHKSAGFFRKEVRIDGRGPIEVSIEIPLEANELRP